MAIDMLPKTTTTSKKYFIINLIAVIIIAALFAGASYYYQNQQLADLRGKIQDLNQSISSLQTASLVSGPSPTSATPTPSQAQVISAGPRDLPRVALTFDADMTASMKQKLDQEQVEAWYDPKLIEILNQHQVPATFFLTGMWAETYPELTKKIFSNDLFEIGNHSYQTKAFNTPCYGLEQLKTKPKKLTAMNKTQQVFKDLTGKTSSYFRFPGGCYTDQDVKLVNGLGLRIIQWDVISEDAFADDASEIVEKTLNKVKNGSIVIMHVGGPNAPYTAEALKSIIKKLRKDGFELVTISDLLSPPTVTE